MEYNGNKILLFFFIYWIMLIQKRKENRKVVIATFFNSGSKFLYSVIFTTVIMWIIKGTKLKSIPVLVLTGADLQDEDIKFLKGEK